MGSAPVTPTVAGPVVLVHLLSEPCHALQRGVQLLLFFHLLLLQTLQPLLRTLNECLAFLHLGCQRRSCAARRASFNTACNPRFGRTSFSKNNHSPLQSLDSRPCRSLHFVGIALHFFASLPPALWGTLLDLGNTGPLNKITPQGRLTAWPLNGWWTRSTHNSDGKTPCERRFGKPFGDLLFLLVHLLNITL